MTRELWRRLYRLNRIARREALKAYQDVLVWGTGAVLIDRATGESRHVPFCEIKLPSADPNLVVARMGTR